MSITYPLFEGNILDVKEDTNELDLHICIDSEKHIYLKEHIFGGQCFMPATMVMELLFEAAFIYCETKKKINVDEINPYKLIDLSIMRGITMLPGEKTDINIKVVEKQEQESLYIFETVIYSNRTNKMGKIIAIKENVTSKVLLSKEKCCDSEIILPKFFADTYNISCEELYRKQFPGLKYHFHTCQSRFQIDKKLKYCIGEFDLMDKEKTSIKGIESNYLTSPLGNDACLQIAVFFSRIINLISKLPIGGDEIEMVCKNPIKGKVNVLVECLQAGDDTHLNITSFYEDKIYTRMKNFVVRKSPYNSLISRQELDDFMNSYKYI